MGSGGGLEAVLAEHEPHTAQGGVFCECGAWEHYYDGFGSEETYAQHLAAAVAAHLQAVAGEARAAVARAVREETRVGPLGPNALEILNSGGVTSMTPTEAETAADAAIAAYLKAVTR